MKHVGHILSFFTITFLNTTLTNQRKYLLNIQMNLIYWFVKQKFEDTKRVIRICKSKKNIQHIDQQKKDNYVYTYN